MRRQYIERFAALQPDPGPKRGTFGPGRPQLRLLVLGDSLAAGVGSQQSAVCTTIAQNLAKHLGHAVSWQCVAVSGADVDGVRKALKDEIVGTPDVVVLIVGLNDLKRCDWAFSENLQDFVEELRSLGPNTKVFLPLLDANTPPILQKFPSVAQAAICFFYAQWEQQKVRLAEKLKRVYTIGMSRFEGRDAWAVDGAHLSSQGYSTWGKHLAKDIHLALQSPGYVQCGGHATIMDEAPDESPLCP
jgi:lysophospholipase L1-like esterase